jgi:hypothetical protein
MVKDGDAPRHLTANITSTACVSASSRQQDFESLSAASFKATLPLQQLALPSPSCFFIAIVEQHESLFGFDLDRQLESLLWSADIDSSRIAKRGGVIPCFLAHTFRSLGLKQQQLVQH